LPRSKCFLSYRKELFITEDNSAIRNFKMVLGPIYSKLYGAYLADHFMKVEANTLQGTTRQQVAGFVENALSGHIISKYEMQQIIE